MTARVAASRVLEVSADDAFGTLTDIARLPEWNDAITAVLHRPDHLDVGAEWVVEMHALGQSWHSRSRVDVLDAAARCFSHRSVTDDGNPSYALWSWDVSEHPRGARVAVSAELHPRTFWRRVLLVHIRSRQLAHELDRSLAALEAAAKGTASVTHRVGTGSDR